MDCRRLEERLEGWLGGTLDADVASALEAHAARCADCRELLELATAAAAGSEPPDLTGAVLRRTSGAACSRAEDRLAAWLDGALEAAEAELVAAHVERCRACADLATVVERLPVELAAMAEAAPPARFVEGVLARTLPPSARWRRAWRPVARRWMARPRFAVEAAYLATALVALVVGLAPRGAVATPERAAEWLRQPVEALGGASGPGEALAAVGERAEQTRAALGRAGDGLRTFWQDVASMLENEGEETPEQPAETEERS